MPQYAYKFAAWLEINERDENGNLIKRWSEFDSNLIMNNSLTFSYSLEKSLTSYGDTATIRVVNHPVLEQMYREKKMYFDKFRDKHLEVSLMFYYEYPHVILHPDKLNCIFTGDLVDIYTEDSSSTTENALVIKATAGYEASLRAEVNKNYSAGMPYRDVITDLFTYFNKYGHELSLIDDPTNKLNKPLKRSRTFHTKVVDAINDIAKDLDMIWSFDSTPWTYQERGPIGIYPGIPSNPAAINNRKRSWFADKISVFDVTGLHANTGLGTPYRGINALEVNGSTWHTGLIGYTKSQFTFNKRFDPSFNVGMPVLAADVGAINQYVEFIGRINRISYNNNDMHCECSYLDPDTGLALLEKDGKNTGSLLL